ncbi:septal ring lytic transglycosylase RlpA family protein [Thiospirillum jenense]|uniref:Endolytic peptidoglycan transglycosylase RlpA n=1 Tax=Thiospirillum jenense TaxID=1653858 RepID=A0A839HEM4_9GAMM|nr:septal ring lytic transglycosylase RlpA family protein [Thiospirillum jenense]
MIKPSFTAVSFALLSMMSPLTAPAVAAGSDMIQNGVASYYHDSLDGNKTASGQRYDRNVLSAAHKTLPLGTRVRVTDVKTGKSVIVRVNDRGPFVRGRIIDLSWRAARQLRITKKGIAKVKVEVLSIPNRRRARGA